jgi:chromosome segregation ATPase
MADPLTILSINPLGGWQKQPKVSVKPLGSDDDEPVVLENSIICSLPAATQEMPKLEPVVEYKIPQPCTSPSHVLAADLLEFYKRAGEGIQHIVDDYNSERDRRAKATAMAEEWERRYKESETSRNALAAKLERTEQELRETTADLRHSQSELRKTQAELNHSQSELHKTQVDLRYTKDQLTTVEEKLRLSQSKLHETQAELQHSRSELDKSQANLHRTKELLATTEENLRHARSELGETRSKLHALEKQLSCMRKEVEDAKRHLEQLKKDIAHAKHELKEKEAELKAKEKKLLHAENEAREARVELQKIKESLAEFEEANKNLKQCCGEYDEQVDDLRKKLADALEHEEEANGKAYKVEKEKDETENALAHVRQDLTKLRAERSSLFLGDRRVRERAPFFIVGVVYGGQDITKETVIRDILDHAVAGKPFHIENGTMGGDPRYGTRKSATIAYTVHNRGPIRFVSGWEHDKVMLKVD